MRDKTKIVNSGRLCSKDERKSAKRLTRWVTLAANHLRAMSAVATIILAFSLILAPITTSAAAAKPKQAAMVIDGNTGKVLYSSAGDEPRYPASLTKMMTLYMAFDLISKGRLSYESQMTVSAQAAAQPPSKLGLKVGDKIRVIDAIKALVTKSANDIAVVMAEHIAGSEPGFARLMTSKARELGMTKTVFKNASGLPDSDQVTTARDMLTLALALSDKHPRHYRLFKTTAFTYRGKRYRNHNTLLGRFDGVDGIKTGYIRAAGFNLVSSVRRDGKHIVAAVFGGKTAGVRNKRMRGLLTTYLKKGSTTRTRESRPMLVARPHAVPRPKLPPPANPVRVTRAKKTELAAGPIINTAAPIGRPSIEIAQVRRVDVLSNTARRQKTRPSKTRPHKTRPAPAVRKTAPALRPGYASGQPDRRQPASDPTRLNGQAPGRTPGTLQDQLASILANSGAIETSQQARPAVQPAAQRTRIEKPQYALRGPDPTSAAKPYIIQVGAYQTRTEAENQLAAVARKTDQLLTGFDRQTQPVASGSRTLYRARFAGFGSQQATETCTELRRRGVDCFVTRAQ